MSFEKLAFQATWRTYQARVLQELDIPFKDKRLRIVAAPVSGKTILELETMRRIAKPTLILAPSLGFGFSKASGSTECLGIIIIPQKDIFWDCQSLVFPFDLINQIYETISIIISI